MNTKNLTLNQKMFAVIVGVAIFAIAGVSVASAQTAGSTGQTNTPPQIQGSINLPQILLSNVKTNFSDAANTAAGAVTNGKVIGGSLTEAQGYLVYAFKVIDDKNMVYSVIVDPSDGKVLYTSPGHSFQMGGFGIGQAGGMKHGHHMGGHAWNTQNAPPGGTNTPSGTITPSSDLINPTGLQ
jgi:uncharacterized membrane protein YkoI